jgi:hypothetical protein
MNSTAASGASPKCEELPGFFPISSFGKGTWFKLAQTDEVVSAHEHSFGCEVVVLQVLPLKHNY